MSDEEQEVVAAIYVLPTEPGLPPRAVIGPVVDGGIAGIMSVWSADMGTWTIEGTPVDPELSETITEHAKSLGVEWS